MQYLNPKKEKKIEKKDSPKKTFTKEIFETVLKSTVKPLEKQKAEKEE